MDKLVEVKALRQSIRNLFSRLQTLVPQGSYDEFSKEELIMIATGLDEVMPLIEEIENKVAVLNTKMERIENDFASIETNMTTSLSEKADVNHTHDDIMEAVNAKSGLGHTHDDRYYTESEVNTKLAAKANSDHNHTGYASTSHNHDSVYAKTSHTHNDYAATTHTHSGYAASNHTHTAASIGAAATNHTHDGSYYQKEFIDSAISDIDDKLDAIASKSNLLRLNFISTHPNLVSYNIEPAYVKSGETQTLTFTLSTGWGDVRVTEDVTDSDGLMSTSVSSSMEPIPSTGEYTYTETFTMYGVTTITSERRY